MVSVTLTRLTHSHLDIAMERKILVLSILLSLLFSSLPLSAEERATCYQYSEKDGQPLSLDYYRPEAGRASRGTVIFMFGGSFQTGSRDAERYLPWFGQLTREGFSVVSIDYRLGMKGEEYDFSLFGLLPTARRVQRAVDIAVEDLFDATAWLLRHHEELGIDPDRLILSGSSAGAIAVLTAEWELCNRTPRARVLPQDFRYIGVISYAGAILSHQGVPTYQREPCPQLLLHGTEDTTVVYEGMRFGRVAWYGSSKLADLYSKSGYSYRIYRYAGLDHRVADLMSALWPETLRFLEESVEGGRRRIVDALVVDPSL